MTRRRFNWYLAHCYQTECDEAHHDDGSTTSTIHSIWAQIFIKILDMMPARCVSKCRQRKCVAGMIPITHCVLDSHDTHRIRCNPVADVIVGRTWNHRLWGKAPPTTKTKVASNQTKTQFQFHQNRVRDECLPNPLEMTISEGDHAECHRKWQSHRYFPFTGTTLLSNEPIDLCVEISLCLLF